MRVNIISAYTWLAETTEQVITAGEHDIGWIVGVFIITIPGIIAAVVALLNRRDGRAIRSHLDDGHKDPLRSDLDRVLEKLDDMHTTLTDHGERLNSIESHLRARRH